MSRLLIFSLVLSALALSLAASDERPVVLLLDVNTPVVDFGSDIDLSVRLKNVGSTSIWVFGGLRWGFSGSLKLHVEPWGPDGPLPVFVDHGQFSRQELRDSALYVKLDQGRFIGVDRKIPLTDLVRGPGEYRVWVEYLSPSPDAAFARPFWSSSRGAILSNVVSVVVEPNTSE